MDSPIQSTVVWTQKVPTEEGFYRMKAEAINEDVFYVFFEPDGRCAFHVVDDDDWMYADEFPDALWSGPVSSPCNTKFKKAEEISYPKARPQDEAF